MKYIYYCVSVWIIHINAHHVSTDTTYKEDNVYVNILLYIMQCQFKSNDNLRDFTLQ